MFDYQRGKLLPFGYDIHRASHGFSMALIEIDGLPINGMVIFHGYVSHNQMAITITFRWSPQWFDVDKCQTGKLSSKPRSIFVATHGYITLSNSSHNEGVFEDFQPAFSLDGNQLTQRHSPSASLPGRLRWNSPVKPPQAWQHPAWPSA